MPLMITGGLDPLTIEVTGLPAGLTVNARTYLELAAAHRAAQLD